MAKDNDRSRSLRNINKQLDRIDQLNDKLYQQTYSTRDGNTKGLNAITSQIDDNLDELLSQVNGQEISDISSLYIRLNNKSNTKKTTTDEINNSIESLFDSNKHIVDSINLDNIRKSIQAENYQIDLICKYMSKLEDALDIKKDNVLSSDNFTKEFINVVSDKSSKVFIDTFNGRAIILKEKYKIQELFEDMYYKASKYGEYFLYHVPYAKALNRLLERKQRLSLGVRYESTTNTESKAEVLLESNGNKLKEKHIEGLSDTFIDEMTKNNVSFKILFDESGIVPEPIQFLAESKNIQKKTSKLSLCESFKNDSSGEVVNEGELKFEDDVSQLTSDGYFSNNYSNEKVSKDINGSVLYEIPRENIIPVYMHRTPIGYIYIQVANNYMETMVLNGNTYNSLMTNTAMMAEEYDKQNDLLVSYIAAMMSEKIDAKFINANIDLKEQIYAVLRYNDYFNATRGSNMITVSFLPAEDIHHFYFRMNEKTHRGISDLDKSLIPGMIYCLLYLNTTIGSIGRSQDKRVYYVKQNVEQNVARTLLNVINQLKKGNMGMRQLENMNTIFNIIGKYNDHVIPMSQSGDTPIQMEVMQGQQIDTPTELLERMEDAAVSATDVPLEFIQSVNSVDYAARFTMSNSKFLRKVLKRQSICQNHFTAIFRKIYNFEYNENDTTMKILLPAPAFLIMSNSKQLIDNVREYAQAICDIVCADKEDDVKSEFMNIYIRNQLGTYIDFTQVDHMVTMAEMNIKTRTDNDMGDGSSDEYGGYD